MTDIDYHSSARIGRSGLKLVSITPRHYYSEYLDPNREWKEPSKALRLGTALHTAVLEPELYRSKIIIEPTSWPTKKECGVSQEDQKFNFNRKNRDKTIISVDDSNSIHGMYNAIFEHPLASRLLGSKGFAERAILFDHPETGSPSKIKPDWYNEDENIIIDIKSTDDASPEGFAKSCVNYWYHVQAPWYLDGFYYANGIMPRAFIFIVVEKERLFNVAVYYAPPDMIELGRSIYLKHLRTYEKCRQANYWPGYSENLEPINLPTWAFRNQ